MSNDKKITVEYSSNNSGGCWWLTDENWLSLEKAGWKVEWYKPGEGHIIKADKDGRIMGALATEASFECKDPNEAIVSWASATELDPWDEGCNCCGNPHSFSYTDTDGNWHSARTNTISAFSGWS